MTFSVTGTFLVVAASLWIFVNLGGWFLTRNSVPDDPLPFSWRIWCGPQSYYRWLEDRQ